MINRFVFNELKDEILRPEINILLGPRQVGKTTLLKQLESLSKKKGLETTFFDLEQPQVLAQFNLSDTDIIEKIRRSGRVVFIDEFQYLRNISKILKAIYDSSHKIKLICSGSSSLEIHKHLKESLAGRRLLFRIYPLTHEEIHDKTREFSIEDYLRFGGMPALVGQESEQRKQRLLSELLSAYILKDVKSLIKEENIRAFNHLLYLLAQNQGSLISAHSLSREIKLSSKAVEHYLDILEATFVHFRVYSYSNNLGNELKKSCKSYLYDLGIRNAILKDFSKPPNRPDRGSLFESFVFLRLHSFLGPDMEIKFWRTKDGQEVDFVLVKDRRPIPIEVKCELKHLELPKGLRLFLARYPKTREAYVINRGVNETLSHGNCQVHFLTFEQFSKWHPGDLSAE